MAAAPARDFSSHITFAGRTAVAGRPPRSGDPWAAGRIADDAVLDKLGVGSARKADGLLTEAARSSEGLVMLFSNCQPLCVGGTAPQPLFLPAREALAALGITECVTSDAAARGPAPASPIEGTDVVSALLGVLTLLSDGAPAGQSAPSHPRAKDGAAAVLRGSLGEASVGGVVAARPLLAVDVGMQGRLERPDDAVLAELLGRLSAGGLACKGMAGAPAGPLSGILGDGERAAFLPPRALMAMPEEAAATAREALAAVDAGSSSALDLLATALPRSGPAPAAAGLFAQARSLLIWHRRSAMCGACGGATAPYDAGVKRSCAACGTRNYPRTDSVAIAAVLHGAGDDEHLLVGRQAGWPPGMHSCLSGFVDAGETLEEAVRREIGEEAGETGPRCPAAPRPHLRCRLRAAQGMPASSRLGVPAAMAASWQGAPTLACRPAVSGRPLSPPCPARAQGSQWERSGSTRASRGLFPAARSGS